jgi:aromatic ring-opening dioxygenase catalytic subunit (LigB family)
LKESHKFNQWLKDVILFEKSGKFLNQLADWENAPGARICHPREEHLLPLFVVAAAGDGYNQLIYDETQADKFAVSGYAFS